MEQLEGFEGRLLREAMSSPALSQLLLAMMVPLLELESTFVPTDQSVSTG